MNLPLILGLGVFCFIDCLSGGTYATPVDCTQAQLKTAKSSQQQAGTALTKAIQAIQNDDPGVVGRLEKWLGVHNSSEAQSVKASLTGIAVWLDKASFVCENQTTKLGDVYAYVDPSKGLVITLANFFFEAPESGFSSKLGVLVHEASHFALAGAAKDPKIYGPTEALALAKTSPVAARDNAENFEYFVESFHFGLTP